MKNIFIMALLALTSNLLFGQVVHKTTYNNYFDEILPGVGFEMVVDDFKETLDNSGLTYRVAKSGRTFFVDYTDKAFNKVTFGLNSNAGPILTEIQMEFANDKAALEFLESNFGKAKKKGGVMEWSYWNQQTVYHIRAWQFSHKLFFVAQMEHTRWALE